MSIRHIVNVEGVIVRGEHYLLVTRGAGEAVGAGTISLVGGKVEDPGSTPDILEVTLRREVQEEVGLSVVDTMYVHSSAFIAPDDGSTVVDVVFLCTVAAGDPHPAHPDEVAAVHWLTLAEALVHPAVMPWTQNSLQRAVAVRTRMGW
jgi:8-oxo-dGTP pyrophosphatase MutT (NUDIX family)